MGYMGLFAHKTRRKKSFVFGNCINSLFLIVLKTIVYGQILRKIIIFIFIFFSHKIKYECELSRKLEDNIIHRCTLGGLLFVFQQPRYELTYYLIYSLFLQRNCS